MRDEGRDVVPLDLRPVARRADDLYVAAAELGRFEDRLAAAAAGGDGSLATQRAGLDIAPRDRDPRDIVEAEGELSRGKRALLRADPSAHSSRLPHAPSRTLGPS